MSTEDSEAVIRKLYGAMAAQDGEAGAALVAPEFVNHAAGDAVGPAALLRLSEAIDATFGTNAERVVDDLFAAGDRVCVREHLRGTHQASRLPFLEGLPPTGVAVEWTFIHIWRVSDGKVIEHWAERNDLALRRQIEAAARQSI